MPNSLTECDLNYYRSRMNAELALADGSGNPLIARAHRVLAAKYCRLTATGAPGEDDEDLLPPFPGASSQAMRSSDHLPAR